MFKLKAKNLKSYSPVYDPDTEVIVDYQDVILEGWASTEKRDSQGDILTKEYYTGLGRDVFAEFLKPLGAAIMDICHKASPSNPGGQDAESVCGHYTVCEWRENPDYDPNDPTMGPECGVWVEGPVSNDPGWRWLRFAVVEENISMLSVGTDWVKQNGREYCEKINEIAVVPLGANSEAFMHAKEKIMSHLKMLDGSLNESRTVAASAEFRELLSGIEKLSADDLGIKTASAEGKHASDCRCKKCKGATPAMNKEALKKLYKKLKDAHKSGKLTKEMIDEATKEMEAFKAKAKEAADTEAALGALLENIHDVLHGKSPEDGEDEGDNAGEGEQEAEDSAEAEDEAEDEDESEAEGDEAGEETEDEDEPEDEGTGIKDKEKLKAKNKMASEAAAAQIAANKAKFKNGGAAPKPAAPAAPAAGADSAPDAGAGNKGSKQKAANAGAGETGNRGYVSPFHAPAMTRGYSLKTQKLRGYHTKALSDFIEKCVMAKQPGQIEIGMDHSAQELMQIIGAGRAKLEEAAVRGTRLKASVDGITDAGGSGFVPQQTTTDYFLQLYLEAETIRAMRPIVMTSNEVKVPAITGKPTAYGLPAMGYGTPTRPTQRPEIIRARPIGMWQELSDSWLRDAVVDPMSAVQAITTLAVEQAAESMAINGENLIDSDDESYTGDPHFDGSLWGSASAFVQPDTSYCPPEFFANGLRKRALVDGTHGVDITQLLSDNSGDPNYDFACAVMDVVGQMGKYANGEDIAIVLDPVTYNRARKAATFIKQYAASVLWTLNGKKLETILGWKVLRSERMQAGDVDAPGLYTASGIYDDVTAANNAYRMFLAFYTKWAYFGVRDSVYFQVVQDQYNFGTILKSRMRAGFGTADVSTTKPYVVAGIKVAA